MKKIFVVLMLMLTVGFAQANLINNGDFEGGTFVAGNVPDGWSAYYSASGSYYVNWKSGTGAHGGDNYVQVIGWSSTWGSMFQTNVPVTAGETYTFSLWAKGDGQVDNSGPSAYWMDSLGSWISTAVYETFTAGATWEFHEYTSLVAPVGAESLSVYLWAGTDKITYYDDVSLVPEPVTLSLLGLGALMLRRRKKA